PGITAALGCAASSLIPLTHRGLARSLTLVTGHLMDEGDYQGWQGLTRAGHTLVFYMGLERAAEIRQGLLAAGASPDLPVALVVAGCSARQQVHENTLDGLAQAAGALLGQSPVLMIMGRWCAFAPSCRACWDWRWIGWPEPPVPSTSTTSRGIKRG
uniref:uroporphyrinogen-III C-methyltransferase n=1 Tax=Aeromonas hydrophila TaxID=644 RepID=UPI000B197993